MTIIRMNKGANKQLKYLEGEYWKTAFEGGKFRNLREAITLNSAAAANKQDFHVYAVRLLDVMLKRIEHHAQRPFSHSSLVEIGCGVGRFTLPLACRFQHVHAVDISLDVLEGAQKYCRSVPNATFYQNDGATLSAFADASIDYVFTTGVLQHIPRFELIAQYLKEGLRILKPNGVYFFSFQVHFTNKVGQSRQGARITAEGLDQVLAGQPYEILELSLDPQDPLLHVMALIRKTDSENGGQKSFRQATLLKGPYRTGQFEDLAGYQEMVAQWREPVPRLTFYDPDDSIGSAPAPRRSAGPRPLRVRIKRWLKAHTGGNATGTGSNA